MSMQSCKECGVEVEHRLTHERPLLARVRYERDCWIFVGHIAKISGYGQIGNDDSPSRAVFTHRASYEIFYGPITTKLHIDHLCRRRACLNPAHLEAVTQTENNRRTRRATCRRGHPRSSGRDCNECQRVRRAAQKGRTA